MNSSKQHQEHYLNRLDTLLKNAKVYPKWAVITFMVMVLLTCTTLFYTYTIKTNAINAEKEAYQKGENAATEYINIYLSENPKAFEEYKKWLKTK